MILANTLRARYMVSRLSSATTPAATSIAAAAPWAGKVTIDDAAPAAEFTTVLGVDGGAGSGEGVADDGGLAATGSGAPSSTGEGDCCAGGEVVEGVGVPAGGDCIIAVLPTLTTLRRSPATAVRRLLASDVVIAGVLMEEEDAGHCTSAPVALTYGAVEERLKKLRGAEAEEEPPRAVMSDVAVRAKRGLPLLAGKAAAAVARASAGRAETLPERGVGIVTTIASDRAGGSLAR